MIKTPGPRTRSRARAEGTFGHQQPTAISSTKENLPDLPQKESATSGDGTINRTSSLIPAYHFNDTIEDLSLDHLMGTPFTCEVVNKTRSLKTSEKEVLKTQLVEPKSYSEENDEEIPDASLPVDNAVSEAPPSCPAAEDDEQEQVSEGEDTPESLEFALASALNNLSLGQHEEHELPLELMRGPLRGLPAPAGAHIRFDDSGAVAASPRQKIFLRGMPEPLGKHTKFEEGDESEEE